METTIPLSPLPDHLKKPEAEPEASMLKGWWSLRNLIGSRAGVLNAVAVSGIPDDAKAFIKSRIEALDQKLNHIELDAHVVFHDNCENLDMTLKGSTVL